MKNASNDLTAVKPLPRRGLGRPTVYGIPNCDVTQKALAWFKENKISITFHDYKTAGSTKEKLMNWCKKKSWEILLNKRSTTWRSLSAAEQGKITGEAAAINLMMAHNSIIKRPVIENADELIVGFNEEEYQKAFK
jgi:arsenate reductase